MTAASGSIWVAVEHSSRDRTRPTVADKRPKSALDSLSPEEIRQQQNLLDHYRRRKREFARSGGAQLPPDQPTNASPRPQRQLKSYASADLVRITRSPTVSTAGATIAESIIEEPFSPSLPPIPPIPSSYRHRHVTPHAQPATLPRAQYRSKTGPVYEEMEAGLLNVAGVGTGPSIPTPQIPRYRSFPVLQVPLELPLESLPPGYDFALRAQFRPEAATLRPLRLLSLDGGGVRGISSLRILKVIMDRIRPGARPCDYFDLIAGTSTGGLIAIMLGRLRMTVDDCIKQYHHLAKKIFKRHLAIQLGSLASGEHRFSPANLEEGIKNLVAKASPSNSKMADHHPRCARTFVLAVKKHNVNNQAARRVRTYATKTSPADTCEIWEAGRATSAAPSYFPSIKIPDEQGQPCSYVDGGLGYNNPSKELLNEARGVFGPEHSIGCFISIGTGRDKNVSLSNVRKFSSAYQAFRAIALSSEQAHWNMKQYFSRNPDVYFRFNAGARLIDTKGDEDFVRAVSMEDWHKMKQIEGLTEEYLAETDTEVSVSKCARKLASISRT